MKMFVIAFSALSLLASTSATAAVCRDKGKFVKCPQHHAVAAQKCRDPKGHFVKCGTRGARPA